MYRTWLAGATGVVTLVIAVVLMARSAPASHAPSHGGAIVTQSVNKP
jgi:hypothetical protein